MKTVFVAAFQDEAIVISSMLRSAGIEAEMLADKMLDINPLFSIDMNGVKILVPDEQEEDARAIVDDYRERKTKTASD
jgi:hypothetical protein